MPHIYDNLAQESRLGPALREALGAFERLDVATGYLDLRGWAALADLIQDRDANTPIHSDPQVRVLIGMVLPSDAAAMLAALQQEVQPPAFGSEINSLEKALAAKDQLVKHLRAQLTRGLPSEDQQRVLQNLKVQLGSGAVDMKVFTDAPLHGKTYIFHAPDSLLQKQRAYVGSSNLTGAGLNRNLELNIDVVDQDATAKLSKWFDARWDAKFSLKVDEEVIDLIAQSWADEQQPSPYEVYLKVCHSLSIDAREGMGYVLPPSMQNLLLSYQETAVRTLARRIVRRGGTMLGDVVGLGKTLTAIATALMLEAAEDFTTLILCPKNLESMWQEHLDRFGLDGARVVPYSMADRLLPELKRFHLVICDESHNLRNNYTKAFEAVYDYIRRNGSKVLLLTATPYNLAFTDVANQISLFIDEDQDLGIQPTAALAKDPTLAHKVDGKVTTLAAFRRSEEAEDWKRLMSDHLVRRTRSFIKRTAKKELVEGADGSLSEVEYLEFADGTRFRFPSRVARPVSHEFSEEDPARLMEDDATLNDVQSMLLPRYRLADYEDAGARHTKDDARHLADIRSGRGNVSGFVRVGLFKRLSSSGQSFILSLQRQRSKNELFVYAIDNKLQLPLGSFSEQRLLDTDEDPEGEDELHGAMASRYEDLRQKLPSSTKWINSTVFTPDLRADLERDNATIKAMLDRFGSWDSSRDSKIDALVDLIRNQHRGEKVLVFTEYVDTADYVAAALTEAGVGNVAVASGSSDDPAMLARRFSPNANQLPGSGTIDAADAPIDVLVATDVLSEGQNLQDAHIVVNYDLPWAIIRVIQRAGRVDRVGQRSDTVFVYLISHDNVERAIQLRQRIKARLGASAEAFGSDEQFFGSDDEVKVLDDLYKGTVAEELDSADGEVDAVSEAWLVWSTIKDSDPGLAAKVAAMQDMVHSTRDRYPNERRGGVACYVSTESGMDAFAYSSSAEQDEEIERLITPAEALRLFQAQPSTPTVEMRSDHYRREAQLIRSKLSGELVTAGNLHGPRKWVWEKLAGTIYATGVEEALSAVNERPLTEHAKNRVAQARRGKYDEQDIAALIRQLHIEDRLVIGATDRDDIKIVCSIGIKD